MMRRLPCSALLASRTLTEDQRGASAVEFSIVAAPFIFLMLGIIQIGIYYTAQSALDNGVARIAEDLRTSFVGVAPTFPSGATLKAGINSYGGSVFSEGLSLKIEIRPLAALTGAPVDIVDNYTDYGAADSTLVVRAQSSFVTFTPGLGSLALLSSSALVRRQGR